MIICEISDGLGNQMFQYAFARALGLRNGDTLMLSKRLLKNNKLRVYGLDKFLLSDEVKLVNGNILMNLVYSCLYNYSKIHFLLFRKDIRCIHDYSIGREYKDVTYNKGRLNIYRGMFQSDKYFSEIKEILQNELQIKKELSCDELLFLNRIKDSNSVCLHVRRGDYLNSSKHYVCTLEYYQSAVRLMKEKYPNACFYVFTDDISWAKEKFCGKEFVFSNGFEDYVELSLMSACNHFIISNSTFSWWAQYLSKNEKKTVIAPSIWQNGQKPQDDYIYQEGWVTLGVKEIR